MEERSLRATSLLIWEFQGTKPSWKPERTLEPQFVVRMKLPRDLYKR